MSLIENAESLLAVYQSSLQELEDILLHEIKITTGQDLIITIRFDLKRLPENMPKKWLANHVNAVQIALDLISAEIEVIDLKKAISSIKSIKGEYDNIYKRLIFKDELNEDVLVLKSSWIYISSLNGYQNELLSSAGV